MSDFLGKCLPKERDAELTRIQASVMAVMRPMTSAWPQFLSNGLEKSPDLLVSKNTPMFPVFAGKCLRINIPGTSHKDPGDGGPILGQVWI